MAANREGRRRKLLREDARMSSGVEPSKPGLARRRSSKRIYSEEARHANQPRVTDLIPQRPWVLAVVWLSGLLVPAVLGTTLYLAMDPSHGELKVGASDRFALAVIASLSRWWSCVLLLVAAALAGMTFHLRRYKLDDYRARYRVWLLVVALCVSCSALVVTNLGAGIYDHLATWLSESHYSTLQKWWLPVAGTFGVFVFVRLLVELWCSRSASVVLFLAATCYLCVGLRQEILGHLGDARLRELTAFAATHLGHQQLVFAILLFCRHVQRTAQGSTRSLESRRPKRRRVTSVENNPDRERESRTNRESSGLTSRDLDLDEDHSTKTELRRQRKELRRQQRRAA